MENATLKVGDIVFLRKKQPILWNRAGKMDQYEGTFQEVSKIIQDYNFGYTVHFVEEEDRDNIGINSWTWLEAAHFDKVKIKPTLKLHLNIFKS